MAACADCRVYGCRNGKMENSPEDCLTLYETDLINKAMKEYEDPIVRNIALSSARTEAEGYGLWTRVEEIMEFCRRAGFRKLGLAFCVGLRREAMSLIEVFRENAFEISAAACKVGSIAKESLGLSDSEKVSPGQFEAMCNPIAQAKYLNQLETDLNMLLGLCVGHDTLFFRFSKSPVTVVAVKDRVLAHNPLGALWCRGTYYSKKLKAHHN